MEQMITFDKYLLNLNTVIFKKSEFIFLSSYPGSLVKSQLQVSGQIPVLFI